MIWWTKLEEGSETVIYPPQKKKVKKKIPYLGDWRTQYHSPKVMPKHA